MTSLARAAIAASIGTALIAAAPLPSTAEPGTTDPGTTDYLVRAGDTLVELAREYFTNAADVSTVARANRLPESGPLRTGSNLVLPNAALRNEQQILHVVSASGSVSRGGAALSAKAAVYAGDVIVTGVNSFVTLRFPDGTRMTLPSQTRVRITALDHRVLNGPVARAIELISGRSQYDVVPLRSPRDRFEVRTPVAVAAVRGTQFRVDYDPNTARSVLEVLRGSVAEQAAAAGTPVLIAAGQAAVRASGEGERRVVTLPPPPQLANPAQPSGGTALAVAVAQPNPASRYRFQLARDAAFDRVIDETVTAGTATFAAVGEGAVFVRATEISPDGVEGLPVVARVDRSQPPPPPAAVAPTPSAGRIISRLGGGSGTVVRTQSFSSSRNIVIHVGHGSRGRSGGRSGSVSVSHSFGPGLHPVNPLSQHSGAYHRF